MNPFFHISEGSLKKKGEELCGDQVKIAKNGDKTTVVLSDGLGSGVKANILATLTSEILSTMLNAEVPLEEIIKTVLGTLPVCKVRNIAYATFTIIEIDHTTGRFSLFNFDNPAPLLFKQGHLVALDVDTITIMDRKVSISEGALEKGDFLAVISDGILYAGMGRELNYGWGWNQIAKYLEGQLLDPNFHNASDLVRAMMSKTYTLYGEEPGDDATFVGIFVRDKKSLMVFTGPPLNPEEDSVRVTDFLKFQGKKILCGGTTANLVARVLEKEIETDIDSTRRDVPPVGRLPGIDLITEGILTISKTLELLRQSDGDLTRLPEDDHGAKRLAAELLMADHVVFLVGQKINEWYQNPLLPSSISIRKNLVRDLADFLIAKRKEVTIDYC